jgi:polyisoprenoid-binding protein YceI
MKKVILAIFVFLSFNLVSQTSLKQNQEWLVVSSSVKFKIKNAGFTVDGSFSGLNAQIIFDVNKGFGNAIEASLESKSINTGNSARDGHLKKIEYFDVNNFPEIKMKSTLFSKETDRSFKGYFKLTIKGKTKDVIVPFTCTESAAAARFEGTLKINRLDFGVGESSLILSDNVTINIEINATKK